MNYRIELYDTWGRRIRVFGEVPLMDVIRTAPDRPDRIQGILPGTLNDVSPGYRVRVILEDVEILEAEITEVRPQWGDTRKLILDRYVHFHEVIAITAERPAGAVNGPVSRAFLNRRVDQIAREAINATPSPVHYLVDHAAYPDGAEWEYTKFLARKTDANALALESIESGQWVDGARMDTSQAEAVDGRTIAGIIVDGIAWPDVRLWMIGTEEMTRAAAVALHPEVSDWTDEEYDASGHGLRAAASKAALQSLIDTKGIDFIELNPHRDVTGAYGYRVDDGGRHVALVYGSGECLNAAMVETGHGEVYLHGNGAFLPPDMALKEFFSYGGPNTDSIQDAPVVVTSYDVAGGLFETLTALAHAAGGYIWSVSHTGAVRFREAVAPDRVVFFDPVEHGVALGADGRGLVNRLVVSGNPAGAPFEITVEREASVEEFGERRETLGYFSLQNEEDAALFASGLLDDLAYPEPVGEVMFLHGEAGARTGEIVEVRNAPVRRLHRELDGEWAGRFAGRLVGRVKAVRHRLQGRRVTTRAELTSPLRSVADPLRYIVRSQPGADELFQFRLDAEAVGLDLGYHLD